MITSVPTSLTASTFSGSSPDMRGSRTNKSRGAMIADDPAKRTMNPTDAVTLPLAIVVHGGPKGAPGQTARIKKPADTIGNARSNNNKTTVTTGTHT